MPCTNTLSNICIKKWTGRWFTLSFVSDWLPVNILNYQIFFTVRKRSTLWQIDDSGLLISKIVSITNPSGWQAEFSLTSADTNIDIWDYLYEISYQKPDSAIQSHYWYWQLIIEFLSKKER